MQRQRGLAVLVGGEVLRHGGGDGLVARDDALDQTAHGLDAQRQRDHIEQQQLARGVVARQLVGLDGCAQSDDFVGVEVVEWRLAKKFGHGLLDLRHAGRATHHDHALHVFFGQLRITQGLTHGGDATGRQGLGGLFEICTADGRRQGTCRQRHIQADRIRARQCFFSCTGCCLEACFVFGC